jgi:hypothetical protein
MIVRLTMIPRVWIKACSVTPTRMFTELIADAHAVILRNAMDQSEFYVKFHCECESESLQAISPLGGT